MDHSFDIDAGCLCFPNGKIAVHDITCVICNQQHDRAAVIKFFDCLEQFPTGLGCKYITNRNQIEKAVSNLTRCTRLVAAAITDDQLYLSLLLRGRSGDIVRPLFQ